MRQEDANLFFCGMGSREMKAAGVEILFDASKIAVVGVVEVVSVLADILRAKSILTRQMRGDRPDLLILIDFPDFNLMLARAAKKCGIPVFYYISPQVWAWRTGRVKTMARLVASIGVILPFEESFYRRRGVPAHFVGHPLLDSVKVGRDRQSFCDQYGIDPRHTIIGLLPGSRRKEIANLLPDFLDAAMMLRDKYAKELVFVLPVASTISDEILQNSGLAACSGRINIKLIHENRYDMMAACDAVVAASGTVTLELAILDVPMVVVYKVDPCTYFLGRLLIRHMPLFSLVNLIAEGPIVPELLQDEVTPGRIETELARLLFDEQVEREMRKGLAAVRARLGGPGASKRAAGLALKLLVAQG